MAVLTAGSGGLRRVKVRAGLLAVAAYVLLIAGCAVFENMASEDQAPRPTFSHARHLQEKLTCADCHLPARDGGPPPKALLAIRWVEPPPLIEGELQ